MTTIKNKIQEILNYPLENKMVFILEHKNNELISKKGIIKKESKNMICIDTGKKKIWISKLEGIFLFKADIKIEGSLLIGNYKSRAKRKLKSW